MGRMLWKKYTKNAKYEVGSYEDQNLRHNELTIDPYAQQATDEIKPSSACHRPLQIISYQKI